MKTIILSICFVLMFSAVSFSEAIQKPKETKEPPANVETKPADVKPSEEKPKKVKRIDSYIAVFDLETIGNVDKNVSRPLSESIRREVVKSDKWELIDRGNMDKVLGEQKFQLSGCVTGQCIVEAGQLLGVGKIVAGSVSLIGKTYYLSLSLINAETGKIEAQSEDKCKCELDDLIDSSKRLIAKLMGETFFEPVIASETKQPPQSPLTKGELKGVVAPFSKGDSNKPFSLEELEQNMKREKADWDKKTEDMKLAYNKVLEYEKKENTSPEIKANAWKHFSDSFTEDNPQSKEDDKMRQMAKNQNEYWLAMASGKIIDPATGMELVFVKSGCYQMGDTFGDGESDEKPVHEVCVDDFYIGKYEVTQGQWKAIMGNNPSYFKNCGDNCPVEEVSWNDIQDFITKLNNKTGKSYRLLTEAEWEYAARSGGRNEKYSGGNDIDNVAWYDSNSGSETHPVGQKQPNGLGIYDMSGNVWEWVNDWHGRDYYKNSPKNNPKGPNSGSIRVHRGGGWHYVAERTRSASRSGDNRVDYRGSYGFRVARTR